jgi:dienelactone hydrolase
MKRFFAGVFLMCLCSGAAGAAEMEEQAVLYKHGETELEGYLVHDAALTEKRPGVLVVHEWKGLGDYAKRRARELAELGYVALAVDMYGKGVRPQTHEEAGKQAGIYKSDRALMRARIGAALDVLKEHPLVEATKIGAIGYCFGGTTVLELARSGADVRGVASFHGALSTPDPADAGKIRGKVLVCHGAADSFVNPEVEAFKKEMSEAGVDMRFESYEGAVHSFTVREAGDDPSTGMAYNEEADKRSWESLKAFLAEVFA